ncbi:MFS transporter [Pseudomonas aeruginosa]
MTSLSASPLNVALVQVAGSLPMFFLAHRPAPSPISSTSAATCSACNWPDGLGRPPCWPASPCSS